MRIVIAPDSFKECASAAQVAEAMAAGVRRALPHAELILVPMADGGEGTVDALVAATGGHLIETSATDPLGESIAGTYGILGDGATAVIEMAAVSGLGLVPPDKRNPRITTTRGTGDLMRHALDQGVRRIILGIGGSATNDGGAGMAQALGVRLQDAEANDLAPGGAALAHLQRIDVTQQHPALRECEVLVACDVTNPLCGRAGASAVYGPQKGADGDMVNELDAALRHFGEFVEAQLGIPVLDVPGAGAAGGLGAGLLAFAGGVLRTGVDIVAEACNLDARVQGADLVITGEGALDAQTKEGKTPLGVARVAKRHGIPVVAIAGSLRPGYEALYDLGIDAAFSICPEPMPLVDAMANAERLIQDTTEAVTRTWQIGCTTKTRE